MMKKINENISRDCLHFFGGGNCAVMLDRLGNLVSAANRLFKPVLAVFIAILIVCDAGWGVRTALAAPRVRPTLKLGMEGPQSVKVGQPLEGITIKLGNPGSAAPDSRLRLFIHGDEMHDLRVSDIKVDVKEGKTWKEVPVEPIDGGVMGAIGAEGKRHKNRHKRGGFAITKKMNRKWKIRVTFLKAGQYVVLVAVSPDNGSTHLAQPVSLAIEAI